MRRTIKDIRAEQLDRIVRAIRSNSGPIRWTVAAKVMLAPGSKGMGRFDNMTIQEFVEAGNLVLSWDEEGNSYVNLVA